MITFQRRKIKPFWEMVKVSCAQITIDRPYLCWRMSGDCCLVTNGPFPGMDEVVAVKLHTIRYLLSEGLAFDHLWEPA